MISQQTLFKAEQDVALVSKIKEMARGELLQILSRMREMSCGLDDQSIRDKLLDCLSVFNPESDAMGDLFTEAFTEAFTDAEHMAAERVEEVQNELLLERRQHYPAAAECAAQQTQQRKGTTA